MKHISLFENFEGPSEKRIKSEEHLNSFGYYDPEKNIFYLEIGSDAYNDYMSEFFDGYLEDEKLSDIGYEQWINDIESAVKEFYNPEAATELY